MNEPASDDLTTIRSVLDGDVDAFRSLVERYQKMLFTFVGDMISDRHACCDIAQETFLAAFRSLGDYDACKGKFSTWLLTIARNKCINESRRRRPVVAVELPVRESAGRPEDGLNQAEIAAELDRALLGLPMDQKSAFVLAEIRGLPLEEVGRIVNVPVGTVKSRISRAKEKLRESLRHWIGEDA